MTQLLDDLRLPLGEKEALRRKVLGLLGTGALGMAGLGTAITAVRFLEPNVFFEEATRFPVGRPEDIPVGMLIVLLKQKVYVVHEATGFFALSSTCTHLGCMTRFEVDAKVIACPCHGSRFALSGRVLGGPAPRPLPRVELTLEQGQLVVDTKRRVGDDFVLRA
jgi:cytochrome b6-f complex iron-sulfur subunit